MIRSMKWLTIDRLTKWQFSNSNHCETTFIFYPRTIYSSLVSLSWQYYGLENPHEYTLKEFDKKYEQERKKKLCIFTYFTTHSILRVKEWIVLLIHVFLFRFNYCITWYVHVIIAIYLFGKYLLIWRSLCSNKTNFVYSCSFLYQFVSEVLIWSADVL